MGLAGPCKARPTAPVSTSAMRRDDIRIDLPCNADWDTMTPAGKKRFCADCKKHVHDLSRMSEEEARALMSAPSTEGLCVRYVYDELGKVVFDMDKKMVMSSALNR